MTAPSTSACSATRRCATGVILLDGWSKTYAMTGWRLGYGVWPKALFRCGRAAGDQLPFLRQRRGAICRDRGARRPARAGPPHGRRPSPSGARSIVAALNSLPGVRCAQPGGAFYTFPNICRDRATTPAPSRASCSTKPGSRRSPAPALARSARAICAFPTPTAARRSPRRSSGSAGFSAICRAQRDDLGTSMNAKN